MTINEEGDRLLKQNLAILAGMRQNRQIDDATYFKGVVCIAYEYAVNDSLSSALALLSLIPEVYFRVAQPQQLSQDNTYWEVASELATILVAKGYAGLESDDVRPTQAPAKA